FLRHPRQRSGPSSREPWSRGSASPSTAPPASAGNMLAGGAIIHLHEVARPELREPRCRAGAPGPQSRCGGLAARVAATRFKSQQAPHRPPPLDQRTPELLHLGLDEAAEV